MLKTKTLHKATAQKRAIKHPFKKQKKTPTKKTIKRNHSTKTSTKINHETFLSELSKRREPSPIRALMPLMAIPGMKSLGSGLPNSFSFPIEGLSLTLKSGEQLALTTAEVNEALQYGPTPGAPALVNTLKKQLLRDHKLQYDEKDFSLSVTNGSQNALTMAFEMLINPGDTIVVEKPTYTGALAYLRPLGAVFDAVDVDSEGLIPEKLDAIMQQYDNGTAPAGKRRPKVLYTIPTGQNPAGCTTTNARKQQIYKIAQKYNMIILEDDPYANLYYGAARAPESIANFNPQSPISYLELDTDGRVLRFDSLSKILSSGLRLGTVSGYKPLVEQLNLTTQATTLHCSQLSQIVANKILTHWGEKGWDEHVLKTKYFYAQRRDMFIDKLQQKLGDMVSYTVPDAGMFVFMAINKAYVGNDTDADELIKKKAVDAKVLMLPGNAFLTEPADKMYVRASFSVATPDDVDIALDRFKGLIEQEKVERGL